MVSRAWEQSMGADEVHISVPAKEMQGMVRTAQGIRMQAEIWQHLQVISPKVLFWAQMAPHAKFGVYLCADACGSLLFICATSL